MSVFADRTEAVTTIFRLLLTCEYLIVFGLLPSLISELFTKLDEIFKEALDPFKAIFQAIYFSAFDFCHDFLYFLGEFLLFLKLSQ